MLKMLDEWPIVYSSALTILNSKKKIAIGTLWSKQDVILNNIDHNVRKHINMLTNVYSKSNSIKPMLVNLLSNRNIRFIILCGRDNDNSKLAVLDFFAGENKGVEDVLELADSVRRQIHQIVYCEIEEVNDMINKFIKIKIPKFEEDAINCKEILIVKHASTWSSYDSGYVRRETSIYHLFIKLLKLIITRGRVSWMDFSQEVEVREISNLTAVLTPENDEIVLDSKLIDFGFDDEKVNEYCKNILKAEVPSDVSYTYGSRCMSFYNYVLHELKSNYTTKRAYIPIFYFQDYALSSKPCAVGIAFAVNNNKINATVFFRSHDIFRAWIINIFGFRQIQKKLAKDLKLKLGSITTVSHSAHIYKENISDAMQIVKEYGFSSIARNLDSEGFCVILENEQNIIVKLYSSDSDEKFLYSWEEHFKKYQDLIYYIADHINDTHHVAYLSREITTLYFKLVRKYNDIK